MRKYNKSNQSASKGTFTTEKKIARLVGKSGPKNARTLQSEERAKNLLYRAKKNMTPVQLFPKTEDPSKTFEHDFLCPSQQIRAAIQYI